MSYIRYESIDFDEENQMKKCVYKKNLQRVIRLRNIMKKSINPLNKFMGAEDMDNFNKLKQDSEDIGLIKSFNRLGPPSFMKKQFKKTTVEKYKSVNGKYFGVLV